MGVRRFGGPSGDALRKRPSTTWRVTVSTTAVALFFRLRMASPELECGRLAMPLEKYPYGWRARVDRTPLASGGLRGRDDMAAGWVGRFRIFSALCGAGD